MFVQVNGVRLYFDVEGAGLVPDGAGLREKPTLVLLHGGPGFDHALFKPAFSTLADIAQVIYYDHRGNGRSGGTDKSTWTLAQWGDDVKGLCDALGIERPIVWGHSFGGFVAQAYATRHPEHPAKLILANTAARVDFEVMFAAFERVGGPQARDAARAYWLTPTAASRATFFEKCFPLYRAKPINPTVMRSILKAEVALMFNGPNNEQGRMDFRRDLARVRCPTLVMGGGLDPVMPMPFSETIAASLPSRLVQFERFEDCGHVPFLDDPDRAFRVIREFILAS